MPVNLFIQHIEVATRATVSSKPAGYLITPEALENDEEAQVERKKVQDTIEQEEIAKKVFASQSSVAKLPVAFLSAKEEEEEERDGASRSMHSLASRNTSKSMEKDEYSNPYPVFHLLTPHAQPQDMKSEMVKRNKVNRKQAMQVAASSTNRQENETKMQKQLKQVKEKEIHDQSAVKRIDFINSSNTSSEQVNILPLFYTISSKQEKQQEEEEKYKSVVICDKTLAILFYSSLLLKCELFDLEKNPHEAYDKVRQTGLSIKAIPFQEMRAIINNCRALDQVINSTDSTSVNTSTSDIFTADYGLPRAWKALLPGTKWCGSGDAAANYADLGKRRDLDLCCRAHDHCPIRLKALRSGYDQINLSFYTKSHCDCDEDFKNCLKSLSSKTADAMANFFFNILRVQCIRTKNSSNSSSN